MNNIMVSVIIPVFNGENISKTLESLINQDFKDFEIIVVDDGSTDKSLDIAYDVLSKSNIPHKLIIQRNSGVSVARNHGIDEASGEYIVFLDHDDTVSTNHLSSLVDKVTSFNSDFAYTNLSKIDENGNILSTTKINVNLISTNQFIKLELEMKISFNFCQLIYKTELLNKNNIRFSKDVVYGEDSEFAYRALICGQSVAISHETTYYYLQHNKSTISTVNYNRFNFVEVLENLAEELNNELSEYIKTQRIPKAIFGNMMYFFYNNYPFEEIIIKMEELNLFDKLKNFKAKSSSDYKFLLKSRLFLLNPKLYYKMWKKFKNSID